MDYAAEGDQLLIFASPSAKYYITGVHHCADKTSNSKQGSTAQITHFAVPRQMQSISLPAYQQLNQHFSHTISMKNIT